MRKLANCLVILALLTTIFSCKTAKDIVYFQDMPAGATQDLTVKKEITVKPGDQLSIMVYGDNAELAGTFNLNISSNMSYGSYSGSTNNVGTRAYTVDAEGNINMPVLGTINVANQTRTQIAKTIENALTTRNLLRNPVVNVAFYNMYVSVLGEVGGAKRVDIDKDELTLIDLLSQCGDLTINGKRENVKVIRDVDGKKVAYTVNMCSAKSIYESPVYYLQPNDLVYVEPNDQKISQSYTNGSAMRTPSFWISIVTFLTSMGVLIFK